MKFPFPKYLNVAEHYEFTIVFRQCVYVKREVCIVDYL
jgi:hypothetical protein